jgi:hypothetical protein
VAPPGARLNTRAALLVWGLLTAVVGTLQLRAAVAPPPGTAFSGFFFFGRDGYNYLSFVQQAQDGALLFRNKAVAFDHPAALVNLEWLVTGWLSAAFGGHPALAFAILGCLATLGLLLAAERWMEGIGIAAAARPPALLLLAFGGGLGGVRAAITARAGMDMSAGFYPFMQALSNAHQATATALLAWSLLLLSRETPRATAGGLALGAVLGLSRPFDFVLLGAARALAAVATVPRRQVWRRLRPLAALAPVAAYDLWVFGRSAGFSIYTGTDVYRLPPSSELVWAFGPGLVLAALAFVAPREAATTEESRRARGHLLAWVVVAGLLIASRAASFALQFTAGLGVPILLLAGLTLGRLRRVPQAAVLLAFATTAFALARYAWVPNPDWHVPAERLAVARALRPNCRRDDRVLAPPDIGLYLNALSACRAYVSYEVSPGFLGRVEETLDFYESWSPEERRRFLDRTGLRFLVLPGGAGSAAEGWLGAGAPFEARAWAASQGRILTVYARKSDDDR